MTNITEIARKMQIIGYSIGYSNYLIAFHVSNGTIEILVDSVNKQMKQWSKDETD